MGSPKKIASPYSGLLGIFASLCCVQGPFVAQKSALTDGQQASSDIRCLQLLLPPSLTRPSNVAFGPEFDSSINGTRPCFFARSPGALIEWSDSASHAPYPR